MKINAIIEDDHIRAALDVPNGSLDTNVPGLDIIAKYLSIDIKLNNKALDSIPKNCKNTINLQDIKLLFS